MNIALMGILQQSGTGGGTPTTPYTIWVDWTIGISGASWKVIYDNNNGISKQATVGFGSGSGPHKTLAYFNDTMKVTFQKLNNGGLAEDSGSLVVKQNGTPISTTSFVVNDDVSNVVINLTDLSIGDQISTEINEG